MFQEREREIEREETSGGLSGVKSRLNAQSVSVIKAIYPIIGE